MDRSKMRTLRRYVPSSVKRIVKTVVYSCIDAYQSAMGTRKPMTPPAMAALLIGGGNFQNIGKAFRLHLVKRTGLNKNSTVLEIGSGYGRVAVALTELICPPGRYDGVEIVKKAVDWCSNEITPHFPNFRFHHADVSNPYARSENGQSASSYLLPFEDNTYDVVYLTSVFTHMRPGEIRAYLNEISRVLKPQGKCFITYYLINNFVEEQIASKRATQYFRYDFGDFLSTHKRTPEHAISVSESLIRRFYEEAGLVIDEPILYGSWAVGEQRFSYQDVIVAKKPSPQC
jgi:ubiquinone/menaquinone biosynthesis C-methylase UbiE